MPHYAHENGCSTYLLLKSAPLEWLVTLLMLLAFFPNVLLGVFTNPAFGGVVAMELFSFETAGLKGDAVTSDILAAMMV